jgi:catechol 2,3-dioxygenase-like lactoylglutathione lyase family enzyme
MRMTQIRSLAQPVCRRPGELGVHSLDRFSFAVPDLAAAKNFYACFGLDVRERAGALDIHTRGHPHRWGSVIEGPRKKLKLISFGAYEDDLPRFRERLDRLRIERRDPPPGAESNGLWFCDPDGTLIEIGVAEKTSPDAKSSFDNTAAGPAVRAAPSRCQAHVVRPRRLAHVLVFTRDIPAAVRFYGDVLGLRLSDRSGDMIAFMHGIHGSDHHMIAFVKSEGPGLHHLSWDVASINEIGIGAMQMADKGFSAGWGLGRHVLGSNYFHYVRDPWGSYAEYSSDIDYIPVDHDWKAGDHPPEDSFYVWGPTPPPDFAFNHELAK